MTPLENILFQYVGLKDKSKKSKKIKINQPEDLFKINNPKDQI
jgi:hypothetical protein